MHNIVDRFQIAASSATILAAIVAIVTLYLSFLRRQDPIIVVTPNILFRDGEFPTIDIFLSVTNDGARSVKIEIEKLVLGNNTSVVARPYFFVSRGLSNINAVSWDLKEPYHSIIVQKQSSISEILALRFAKDETFISIDSTTCLLYVRVNGAPKELNVTIRKDKMSFIREAQVHKFSSQGADLPKSSELF